MELIETDAVRDMRRKWIRDELIRRMERRTVAIIGVAGIIFGAGCNRVLSITLPKSSEFIYSITISVLLMVLVALLFNQWRLSQHIKVLLIEERKAILARVRAEIEAFYGDNTEKIESTMAMYEKGFPKP